MSCIAVSTFFSSEEGSGGCDEICFCLEKVMRHRSLAVPGFCVLKTGS